MIFSGKVFQEIDAALRSLRDGDYNRGEISGDWQGSLSRMKWLEQKVSALGRMKDKRIFVKKAHLFQSLTTFNPPSAPDKDVFVEPAGASALQQVHTQGDNLQHPVISGMVWMHCACPQPWEG